MIIGLVGIIISFTPLNNILVPISNRWGGGYNNVSLPTSVMVLGFGVAGAFITIYFRKKEHKSDE